MIAYIAAGYSRKNEMVEKIAELAHLGIQVTSTWPYEPHSPNSQLGEISDEDYLDLAKRDIAEINEADTVILFTQEPTKPFVRGGRMHEFGYAHAAGKRLIVIGPRENIFHYLPSVKVYHSWEAFTNEVKHGR